MKKIFLAVLLFVCLGAAPCLASSPGLLPDITAAHPRLMLMRGEEAIIRDKIASDDFLMRVHRVILKECEQFLSEPLLEKVVTGKRLLSVSRQALKRIYYLSYAWRMTGDSRYAERAEREMVNVCAFLDWNPSHFLDVAEMTAALSIGYDWLYDFIGEETKATIRNAIVAKGLNESLPGLATDKSHYSWTKKKNNWNAVCHTGMSFGAIVTFEHNPELSRRILTRAIEQVRDVALEEYLPDGNYPEGYTYWSYGTGFAVMFIDALEKLYGNSFGMTDNQGFMSSPEYIMQMSTQNLGCFAYSDCGADIGLSFPMFWFAGKRGDNSFLWAEARKLEYLDRKGVSDDEIFNVRFLPSLLIWTPKNALENIPQPAQRLYVGQGTTPVAILRNHRGGPDEIFVGLKGGMCLTNHAHMDIGSFVMYRGTRQWIKDPGVQDYNSLEKFGINLSDRSQYSSRWRALRFGKELHNIMTFNGGDQQVGAMTRVDAYGDAPGFVFASTDLTAVDSTVVRKHVRGVAIVGEKYTVVRDEISNGDQFADIRWAAFTPAEVTITGENRAELSMDGEKMILRVEGGPVTLKLWSTEPRAAFDEANPGSVMVGFTTVLKPDETAAFTVYLIPEEYPENSIAPIPPVADWGNGR